MNIESNDKYKSFLDDIDSTLTEYEFNSRWSLIEGYHKVGDMLKNNDFGVSITELVHRCAVDLEVSERKLWYAVKFYEVYPDIALLPEGKDASWSQIRRKYLTESKTKEVSPSINFAPDAVKSAVLKHIDELVSAAQYTADGVLLFIPKDLLIQ